MAIFESVRGTLVQLERSKRNFQLCIEVPRKFCFSSLRDWSKKTLAPLYPLISCKIKTNCDLVTRVFPRFWLETCFYLEFSLAPYDILLYSYWLMELLLISFDSVDINSITLHSG